MIRDLLVVGAGPAGVSAALWAREVELDALVLEGAQRLGGQLHAIHFHPRDWAGVAEGDGPALAGVMAGQLAGSGIPLRLGDPARALEPPAGARPCAVRTCGGERLEAHAVLVATGLRRRRLEVPGERELEGRGVSSSATLDRERLAGRDVAVVGGGDAAHENALTLAAAGCRVTLVMRGAARARPEFQARVAAERGISVLRDARVVAIEGVEAVRALRVASASGEARVPVEGVVVKVGAVPNTEWCADVLARDPEGYLAVDARLRTSVPGVWAAGDVTRPALPSLTVALGHGALAVADLRAALRGGGPAAESTGRAGRG